MKRRIFAGNWKMHLGPEDARQFLKVFLSRYRRENQREVWFFPPAVSLEAVAHATRDRTDFVVGAQNVHWEDQGAFTGEVSVPIARQAGARAALVGHSERRHVFGETDEETAKKVRALLKHQLTPVLCVGEKLDERERGATLQVVERQLGALSSLDAASLARVVIAYEPVWAIGTGRNATPSDAAQVHAAIRRWLTARGVAERSTVVLYGGSVRLDNVRSLISEKEVDGMLVGGASLDPAAWAELVQVAD
ncbi:MAG: triose-phosphate isomerase [Gemmatimonadetes bacterium]|nr:triose-phosphate isomerase [Gemmatimonadota bacterium]